MEGVVGIGVNKRVINQSCMVRFVCPKCRGDKVMDAYAGPPWHSTCAAWMVPMSLIVDDRAKALIYPEGMPASALPDTTRGL